MSWETAKSQWGLGLCSGEDLGWDALNEGEEGANVLPSLPPSWNVQFLNISLGTHVTNPEPQENSSFFAERSWNGRWLHSQLAVIWIPCWAREQPLIHYGTNIFELNVHSVQRMAHMLHLLHFHYSELAIKVMQNSPAFPPIPVRWTFGNGACTGERLNTTSAIQFVCLHPAHLLKWEACAQLVFNGLCLMKGWFQPSALGTEDHLLSSRCRWH